jgi:hypothetical protein
MYSEILWEVLVIAISLALVLFLFLARGEWQVSALENKFTPMKHPSFTPKLNPERRPSRPARSYQRSYQALGVSYPVILT